uniref:Uncharacterized protein n=1 Tax=Sphaerodactylus townsendi TaxID=933632 RepID=A0ACB8ETK4_9SAUR
MEYAVNNVRFFLKKRFNSWKNGMQKSLFCAPVDSRQKFRRLEATVCSGVWPHIRRGYVKIFKRQLAGCPWFGRKSSGCLLSLIFLSLIRPSTPDPVFLKKQTL